MELIRHSFIKKGESFEGNSKDILLYYVVNGKTLVTANEKEKMIEKDHIIVFNPNEKHRVSCIEGVCAMLSLSYSKILRLMGFQKKMIICDITKDSNETASILKRIVQNLLRCFYQSGEDMTIFVPYLEQKPSEKICNPL